MERRPYFSWMRLNSDAVRAIASSQETSRQGSLILLADHRLEDALAVGGVAPGEAALHAGMPAIGLAVLVGHHANDLVAAHLRLERAADAAIGAGRHHRMLRLADLDDRFFGERRGRARLHAGAARDAFRGEEGFLHAGRHDGPESAPGDGQREGPLHLLAGAHAARAYDAFRRVVGEIGIGLVLAGIGMLVAGIAIAHVAQADGAGHVLQLAVAVGGTGEAIQGVIGDVEFHHPLAQALEPVGLGTHRHSGRNRRGARGRRAGAPFDLDEAEPARAEGVEHVGGAELRDLRSHLHGRPHDRSPFGHRHGLAVDGQRHRLLRLRARRAVVGLTDERHGVLLHSAASRPGGRAPKSSGKWVSALMTG